MVWNAIAGIAGAAASIFGGSDEPEETVTRSEVNYKQMVKAAQKAGINPLTALRNGGAAGFAATTTTQPALASESLLSRIATGTGLIAEGLSNQQKWEASQQRLALEERLIQAQIANLRSNPTGSTPIGGGSPRIGGGTGGNTIPIPTLLERPYGSPMDQQTGEPVHTMDLEVNVRGPDGQPMKQPGRQAPDFDTKMTTEFQKKEGFKWLLRTTVDNILTPDQSERLKEIYRNYRVKPGQFYKELNEREREAEQRRRDHGPNPHFNLFGPPSY